MVGRMSEANRRRRLVVIGLIVVALFAGLLTRLWFLQVAGGEDLAVAAQQNGDKIVQMPAIRGRILDAKGRVLAETMPVTSLVVDRQQLTDVDARRSSSANLATLLGRVARGRSTRRIDDPNYPAVPAGPRRAERERRDRDRVGRARERLPRASSSSSSYVRVYPRRRPQLAAHVVGYVGRISAEEYAARKVDGYANDDMIGKAGVEKLFESELRGVPERERVQVNNRGLAIDSAGDPRGASPVTTCSSPSTSTRSASPRSRCSRASTAPAATGSPRTAGAVVVLDARTGAVVALASNPTFDPNRFADGTAPDEWLDPHGALTRSSTARSGPYAPGSTFKMITAVAQLQGPVPIRPADETYYDEGCFKFGNNEMRCNATDQATGKPVANGSVDLAARAHGVERRLLLRRRQRVLERLLQPADPAGRERDQGGGEHAVARAGRRSRRAPVGYGIQKQAFAFGFGKATGVGLSGDQARPHPDPVVQRRPQQDLDRRDRRRTWRRGDSASLAVGQGDVLVTPLQLANAYATFANGGTLYTPRIASAVLASGVGLPEGKLGDVVHALDPQMLRTGAAHARDPQPDPRRASSAS